jgi:hypothetical protein
MAEASPQIRAEVAAKGRGCIGATGLPTHGLKQSPALTEHPGDVAAEEAVVDARLNARLNGIHNATFVCGDLHQGLVVADRAQAGAHGSGRLPSFPQRIFSRRRNSEREGSSSSARRQGSIAGTGARRILESPERDRATNGMELGAVHTPFLPLLMRSEL